ncbi:hypothetical protein [Caballeronia temeraria]|uniref:hypothetical protein n=1 Tax=Caballeronia temeraria TaxID=1777137 RepID=UPI000B0C96D0|nr:hypothetical protein [Caballeronia temeraria]
MDMPQTAHGDDIARRDVRARVDAVIEAETRRASFTSDCHSIRFAAARGAW